MSAAATTAAMEAALVAAAPHEPAMRAALFDRFLAAFPDREPLFLHRDATSVRMTSETLAWMLGLAAGERWVWGQVAELVFQHRSYGHLTIAEYAVFVDMSVDALAGAAGAAWTPACEEGWRTAATLLKDMLARAVAEWTASPLPYP